VRIGYPSITQKTAIKYNVDYDSVCQFFGILIISAVFAVLTVMIATHADRQTCSMCIGACSMCIGAPL